MLDDSSGRSRVYFPSGTQNTAILVCKRLIQSRLWPKKWEEAAAEELFDKRID